MCWQSLQRQWRSWDAAGWSDCEAAEGAWPPNRHRPSSFDAALPPEQTVSSVGVVVVVAKPMVLHLRALKNAERWMKRPIRLGRPVRPGWTRRVFFFASFHHF